MKIDEIRQPANSKDITLDHNRAASKQFPPDIYFDKTQCCFACAASIRFLFLSLPRKTLVHNNKFNLMEQFNSIRHELGEESV